MPSVKHGLIAVMQAHRPESKHGNAISVVANAAVGKQGLKGVSSADHRSIEYKLHRSIASPRQHAALHFAVTNDGILMVLGNANVRQSLLDTA